MAKSKVVLNYKLEHTNKELGARLTYLARFFSGALMLALLPRDRVFHGVVLTVNFRQPSYEFTFNVGTDLLFQPL
jgi:hypothetical protein